MFYVFVCQVIRVAGGAVPKKRARSPTVVDMQSRDDDPAIVKAILSYKMPTLEAYIDEMQPVDKDIFKSFAMKLKHGDRMVDFIIGNIAALKTLEDKLI